MTKTHPPLLPLILALTGRPDVGKDTVGDLLQLQHGFARIAFADALRAEVCAQWGIDARMLTERHTKETPLQALAVWRCHDPRFLYWAESQDHSATAPRSPRWVMQRWGSFQRSMDDRHYVRRVENWILHQAIKGVRRVVVTDLRYHLELEMLRSLHAEVVRVHRPQVTALPEDTATHVSEQHHLLMADHDLLNDGSLGALADAVIELVANTFTDLVQPLAAGSQRKLLGG